MEVIAKTDIGNVREVNQDYVKYFTKNTHECLAVLCDGMGGHNAGEVASCLACEDIITLYQKTTDLDDETSIQVWMYQAIQHAHQVVFELAQQDEHLKGMGTTVVVALLKDGYLYVSHVGDSRAYLCEDGKIMKLTKDDTLVNALVASGSISEDEAQFHPQKNILLQAVGVSDHIQVSFMSQKLADQIVLLCSDGLYNSLFADQMIKILQTDSSLEELGKTLIDEAKRYGGKDNIGIVLMRDKGVVEK